MELIIKLNFIIFALFIVKIKTDNLRHEFESNNNKINKISDECYNEIISLKSIITSSNVDEIIFNFTKIILENREKINTNCQINLNIPEKFVNFESKSQISKCEEEFIGFIIDAENCVGRRSGACSKTLSDLVSLAKNCII